MIKRLLIWPGPGLKVVPVPQIRGTLDTDPVLGGMEHDVFITIPEDANVLSSLDIFVKGPVQVFRSLLRMMYSLASSLPYLGISDLTYPGLG